MIRKTYSKRQKRQGRICITNPRRKYGAPGNIDIGKPMNEAVLVDDPETRINMHPCPAHRVMKARKTRARRPFQSDPRLEFSEADSLNFRGKDLDRALNVLAVEFRPIMIESQFLATKPVSIIYQAQSVVAMRRLLKCGPKLDGPEFFPICVGPRPPPSRLRIMFGIPGAQKRNDIEGRAQNRPDVGDETGWRLALSNGGARSSIARWASVPKPGPRGDNATLMLSSFSARFTSVEIVRNPLTICRPAQRMS